MQILEQVSYTLNHTRIDDITKNNDNRGGRRNGHVEYTMGKLTDPKFIAEYENANEAKRKMMLRSVLDGYDAEFYSLVNAGVDTEKLWDMGVVETDKFIEQCKQASCRREHLDDD